METCQKCGRSCDPVVNSRRQRRCMYCYELMPEVENSGSSESGGSGMAKAEAPAKPVAEAPALAIGKPKRKTT